ncbi:hypothetical protein TrCOL_g9324 [Triparma columacea]|uniref:Uncharacterized protein n=1 Tax=Triparma columacea TaxID=722753 RepID=A0A9W7LBG1_9STRA|nr:hypothetical protein TrCOL_g9324 [Triparma columacea]
MIVRVVLLFLFSITTFFSKVESYNHLPPLSRAVGHRRQVMKSVGHRRQFVKSFVKIATTGALVTTAFPSVSFAEGKDELIMQLKDGRKLLEPLSDKLQAEQWDAVRSVLKGPGLGELWNLGESKNTIAKLAKKTDNMMLMELGNELQISLQMADQLTYDNAFVYFQPGNGKVDIKGPQSMVKKAISQLDEIVEMAAED